jgi:hypothetical protein
MRELGMPKVLSWRWTPCAALTLGATSFAACALMAIPDQIGQLGAATQTAAARLSLGNGFASTRTTAAPADEWSSASNVATTSPNTNPTVTRVAAARPAEPFPKRGFSPPLERPAPPPAPAPPPQPLVLNVPPAVATVDPPPASIPAPGATAAAPTAQAAPDATPIDTAAPSPQPAEQAPTVSN